ncbi:TadE/TadG family type IV pilus assembly protein [Allosaccharopolyspora coralli]|nr:TadE/TadG family type IV pilus assembly protein [Allosaccharopolyspora coralli]
MPTTQKRNADRGSSTVELAILAPLLLMLVLTVLQAGLWWHTRTVCLHAAERGLTTARTLHGTSGSAHAAAHSFAARHADAPSVDVQRDDERATVRVTATAPLVLPIPGLPTRVTHHASGSVETFTTPEN